MPPGKTADRHPGPQAQPDHALDRAIQARVDERRDTLATLVRDKLGLIQSYNRDVYEHFCKGLVQTTVYMRDSLDYFSMYASYATPETLTRILDRVAYGLATTMTLRMQRPSQGEPEMGSNYSLQIRNIRDALAQVAVDPRAAPALEYHQLGVLSTSASYGMHETDFNYFGAHMMRRARDRAWERVRSRFAARLSRWAERYPQSQWAILDGVQTEILLRIAALVFPYTPYPN
jgi:hypothetical protein